MLVVFGPGGVRSFLGGCVVIFCVVSRRRVILGLFGRVRLWMLSRRVFLRRGVNMRLYIRAKFMRLGVCELNISSS